MISASVEFIDGQTQRRHPGEWTDIQNAHISQSWDVVIENEVASQTRNIDGHHWGRTHLVGNVLDAEWRR